MKNKWCLFYPKFNLWRSSNKAVALNLIFFSYEEIEHFYFLHYNVKSQALFMVSEIKINLNGKKGIFSFK